MSLHAILSSEAQQRLNAQRRNSTLISVILAIMSVILVSLLLGFMLLPQINKDVEFTFAYQGNETAVTDCPEIKRMTHSVSKPTSPAGESARVIVAQVISSTAVPTPELDAAVPSVDFGGNDDFSEGWAAGNGNQAGMGGSSGFGTTQRNSGGLEGVMYDFKKNHAGKKIAYDVENRAHFVDRTVRLQKAKFSPHALSSYYRAPNSLFLSHLAIPFSDAAAGPAFFGAKNEIEPSGWMVHYRGQITVPRAGSYRFAGMGDDYLVLMLNGRVRLTACWNDIQSSIAGRWQPSAPTGQFSSPFGGMRLVYGDWITLRAGEVVDLDLAIGERPGGKVGFILHVEEKGMDYRKDSAGRSILPLFATAPIAADEKQRIIHDFGAYEIDWQNMPVFAVK